MRPSPQEQWQVVEDKLRLGGVAEAKILAMKGVFCAGYETGIEHIMVALNGVQDTMQAVSTVNEYLRDIRRMKQEAQVAGQTMVALRNMRFQVPGEQSGSSDSEPGQGA